jgi:hypothetical protein
MAADCPADAITSAFTVSYMEPSQRVQWLHNLQRVAVADGRPTRAFVVNWGAPQRVPWLAAMKTLAEWTAAAAEADGQTAGIEEMAGSEEKEDVGVETELPPPGSFSLAHRVAMELLVRDAGPAFRLVDWSTRIVPIKFANADALYSFMERLPLFARVPRETHVANLLALVKALQARAGEQYCGGNGALTFPTDVVVAVIEVEPAAHGENQGGGAKRQRI